MRSSAKKCAEFAATHPRARAQPFISMENLLIGLIAFALLGYLVVAVLRPEKF